MSEEYNLNRIIALILSEMNDAISESEREELENWLSVSGENRKFYERLAAGGKLPQFMRMLEEHDSEMSYRRFIRTTERMRRKKLMRATVGIVALFIVILGLAWLVFFGKSDTIRMKSGTEIYAGLSSPVLILPYGEEILLDGCADTLLRNCPEIKSYGDSLTYTRDEARNKKREPEYHRIVVPRGATHILRLSDGTKIWLNAETELHYPKEFPDRERKVFLKGEAYFSVTEDMCRPFIVEVEGQRLKVLGTEFCIRAYEDESFVRTTLESGRVDLYCADSVHSLFPGEQSILEKNGDIRILEVDTELYTSWHKGKFLFRNMPLREILQILSRHYDVDVVYKNDVLKDIRFTGEIFLNRDLQEGLNRFKMLRKVDFKISGRKIEVLKY